jgi:hypothetical protein
MGSDGIYNQQYDIGGERGDTMGMWQDGKTTG